MIFFDENLSFEKLVVFSKISIMSVEGDLKYTYLHNMVPNSLIRNEKGRRGSDPKISIRYRKDREQESISKFQMDKNTPFFSLSYFEAQYAALLGKQLFINVEIYDYLFKKDLQLSYMSKVFNRLLFSHLHFY